MNKMPLAKMLEIRLYKNYSSLEIHRVASDVFFPDLGAVEALVFLIAIKKTKASITSLM